MKLFLLPALFSMLYLCSDAQNPGALRAKRPIVNYLENQSLQQLASGPSTFTAKKKSSGQTRSTLNVIQIGSAGNAFTSLRPQSNCLSANQDLNTVVFIHRNDNFAFPDYTVAQYRYDISTDGGQSFTLNQGPLNPLATNQPGGINARYPQAWIYNPAGNTNPANSWISYLGAWHDGSSETNGTIWNGITYGMMRLNNDTATNTEHSDATNNDNVLIASSMAAGLPGEYWAVDNEYSGFTNDSMIVVYKGVVNGADDDISWQVFTKLNPHYAVTQTTGADDSTFVSIPLVSFDPTGMYGWICIAAEISNNYNEAPVVYKTVNGGVTWSGPEYVDLSVIDTIMANLPDAAASIPTVLDYDVVVDKNGEPHIGIVCSAGSATLHNRYTEAFVDLYDLTYNTTLSTWSVAHIDTIDQLFDYYNALETTTSLTQSNRLQGTISPDGSRVAFIWADRDPAIANEFHPNLYGAALNVDTKKWTPISSFTADDLTWSGLATQHLISPVSLYPTGGGTLTVPVTINDILPANFTGLNPTLFYYLQSISFYDNLMTLDQPFNNPFNSVSSVGSNNSDLLLSPNPSSDIITLQGKQLNNAVISVVNVLGEVLSTETVTASTYHIKAAALPAGFYNLVVSDNGSTVTKKFVVQH